MFSHKLEKINSLLSSLPKTYLIFGIVVTDATILFVDFITGPSIPLSIFYLSIIFFSLKYVGSRFAYVLVFFTALVKTYIKSQFFIGEPLWLDVWRFISVFALYSTFCYLLSAQMKGRRKAENALDELSQLHRSIISGADSGIMVFQANGECMLANEAAAIILGCTQEEMRQSDFRKMSSWSGASMLKAAQVAIDTGVTQKINLPMHTSYGTDIWCVVSLGRIDRKGREPYLLLVFTDMSAYKEAERKIISISEETQQRIGRELHDDLGQHLTGIAFMSEVLSQRLNGECHPNVGDAMKITSLVNDAISKTRKLAQGLYPVEMNESGLRGMLENLANNVEEIHQAECELVCREECRISDSSVVINLFRIAQEAVNNAIRHGRASKISLRMISTPSTTMIEIADNGSGIHGDGVNSAGLGMYTMQYRASLLGGALRISTVPDEGTCISVSLPVQ